MDYKCIKELKRKKAIKKDTFEGTIKVGEVVTNNKKGSFGKLEKNGKWICDIESPAQKKHFEKVKIEVKKEGDK